MKERVRRHPCESFHGELRTEALLCLQPQGADKTPGRGRKKGMTGSVHAKRDRWGCDTKRGSELVPGWKLCFQVWVH